MNDNEILDNIDRDPYPHKLEFSSLWKKRIYITLAMGGVCFWVETIARLIYDIYRLFLE